MVNLILAQQQTLAASPHGGTPTPEPAYRPVIVPCPPSPNHGGPRPRTAGVIIHSTRGGGAYGREFVGTLNWFARQDSQVSAHAVVSRAGEIAYPVPADMIAYHAGVHNADHLGVEFEQPTIQDAYTVPQFAAGAWLVSGWCRQYGIPIDRQHLIGHEESAQGRRAGKTDPGARWDWQRFLALVAALASPVPARRTEVITTIVAVANEHGIPPVALVALGVAESGLDPLARRPANPLKDAEYWPDVSGGLMQAAVRWTKEYQDAGYDGSYPGPEATERILRLYYDPEHSLRTAAPLLKHYLQRANGDPILAMLYYNGPNKDPATNPNRANYERGLAQARMILG